MTSIDLRAHRIEDLCKELERKPPEEVIEDLEKLYDPLSDLTIVRRIRRRRAYSEAPTEPIAASSK